MNPCTARRNCGPRDWRIRTHPILPHEHREAGCRLTGCSGSKKSQTFEVIEFWKFKKTYKAAGFKHHPNAIGYDYSSAADDLFMQMKSYSNPDGAAPVAREAIDSLLANAPQNGSQLRLHIVHRKVTSSTSLKQAIRMGSLVRSNIFEKMWILFGLTPSV
jgi:hypothetical protein